MLKVAAGHLKSFYPDWNEKDLIYDKWHKDKGLSDIKTEKNRNNLQKPTKNLNNIATILDGDFGRLDDFLAASILKRINPLLQVGQRLGKHGHIQLRP